MTHRCQAADTEWSYRHLYVMYTCSAPIRASTLLNVPTAGEQIIRGSVLRVERGALPQLIVNTPNTIVGPLRVGVPVRLYLKSFSNRNAHYIIGVAPLPNGGTP